MHSHLQDERLTPHLEPVLARAREAGVRLLHSTGTSEADWPRLRDLAERHPFIVPSFGLHPWFIHTRSANWMDALKRVLKSMPSGIGEIGLDGRMGDDRNAEREDIFRRQLELSYDMMLPVSVHCRDAWSSMLDIIYALPPHPVGLLIHAYSGPPDAIPKLVAHNVHFSFGGTLTRQKSGKARTLYELVPADRVHLESDAPDLPPDFDTPLHAADGKRMSEPSLIPQYAAYLPHQPEIAPAENTRRWLSAITGTI